MGKKKKKKNKALLTTDEEFSWGHLGVLGLFFGAWVEQGSGEGNVKSNGKKSMTYLFGKFRKDPGRRGVIG